MKIYPLLPALGLLLIACTKEGPIDYRTSYPPFEVRTEGTWSQALWDKRREYVGYTVYCDGELLRMPGVPNAEGGHPRFDWLQPLPNGALLLGRLTNDTLEVPGFELYQLPPSAAPPRLYALGRCGSANPLLQYEKEPDVKFTPDTLGLLVFYPNSISKKEVPPHFIDLTAPAHYATLLPAPTRADGAPLELRTVRWSPDHRWLARTYYPGGESERSLIDLVDLRTGRGTRLAVVAATDTASTASAPLDQVYWRPLASGGYELARRPGPKPKFKPKFKHPAPPPHHARHRAGQPTHRGR